MLVYLIGLNYTISIFRLIPNTSKWRTILKISLKENKINNADFENKQKKSVWNKLLLSHFLSVIVTKKFYVC